MELEREVPGTAGDRAVAATTSPTSSTCARTSSSTRAISSAHFDEATERWIMTTDGGQTIDAQFLVTCCGMLSAPLTDCFPGRRRFKGELLPYRALAEGPDRSRGQARRRRRQRRDRHPGDPDDRRQGWAPDGVRPDAAIRAADEESEIHADRPGGLQGEVRVACRSVCRTPSPDSSTISRTGGRI